MRTEDAMTAEVVELLRTLIRNACVNDGTDASGHEIRSADTLEAYLSGVGLAMERYTAAPGRVSLVTRIDGRDRRAPTLLLLGHTDVVPADGRGWRHDPFAAVTQRDHALQCAALASRAGGDDELVLAALLHDLAHLAVPEGRETAERHHGHRGAALVAPFVPARVAWIIEHHVVAKRYLCAVDPVYLERLSPASVHSLAVQGGPLHREEAMAVAAHPWFPDALNVRRWDEEAKDPQAKTPPLSAWVPVLERYFGPQTLRRA